MCFCIFEIENAELYKNNVKDALFYVFMVDYCLKQSNARVHFYAWIYQCFKFNQCYRLYPLPLMQRHTKRLG